MEVLEQIQKQSDMSCNASLMRRTYYAVKAGSWEGSKEALRDKGEISEWAFAGVKEAYDKVASGDVGRLSIAQDILREGTDFRRRIIAPASGVGGVTLSYVFPQCNCFIWWVSSGHLVVCGCWWPVQLEVLRIKKTGDTGECPLTLSESLQSASSTARAV